MTAAPNARASGERHCIARGIEARRPRRLSGSVHESPVRGQRMRRSTVFTFAFRDQSQGEEHQSAKILSSNRATLSPPLPQLPRQSAHAWQDDPW